MSILFRSSVFSTVIFSKKDKNSAKETLLFTLQSQKVQSVTSCSMFSFDTEKLRNVKITTKYSFSKILIGYSCQSVLPEHICDHKI